MPRELPTGTVTFLFTDVEGSTQLLHSLGPERYGEALGEHRRLLREAFTRHGGVEVDTQGDAFFVAFPTAHGALAAASEGATRLRDGPIRVRMGIHTGSPELTDEGYAGVDVHRAARIAAAGHGGQVLVSGTTASLVDDVELRDLGEHRLKDLAAPERILQLGNADFPRLKSLYATNLPVPATEFVGRDRELEEVTDLLSRPTVRLLTLTGPGGAGKTRLALHAAARVSERFADGVWWVPLAAIRDANLVLPTAGAVLGAGNGLAEHIGDRSMLLLLDNFEQVTAAARDVATVMAACSNLELLVTSRERVGISAEQEYEVPSLLPADAQELFVARARAVRPAFEPDDSVAAVCARLDHLPLAIELAAARVKVMTTSQILARLERRLPLLTGGARDLPERQRTLRGAIEWSHELLTADEQKLFARLSVFRGGWALEDAEAVCEADIDVLQALVDKSLVRRRDERFSMLETIREFAVERLDASDEGDAIRRRHAEHFTALAEEAEPHVRYDDQAWLDRLTRDQDNLRAALDRLEAAGETQMVLGLAGALSRFWYLRSHLAEGRARLERALDADASPSPARARALDGAAVMLLNGGEAEASRRLAEEALALHIAHGDKPRAAYSEMMIGNGYADAGDLAVGREREEAALRRFEELGDEHYAMIAASNVASMSREMGDYERGRELDERNLPRARERGDVRAEAAALGGLATWAHRNGRWGDAVRMLADSTRIYMNTGDLLWTGNGLGSLALWLAQAGRPVDAVRVLASGETLREQIGVPAMAWAARERDDAIALARAAIDDAPFEAAWREGRLLSPADAIAVALAASATGE